MKNNPVFASSVFLFILLCISIFLSTGCAVTSPQIQIEYYDPVETPTSTVTVEGVIQYITQKNDKYEITACLISGKNIFATDLEIKNKTKKELQPEDYSISLFDGRDRLELQMISKEVVENFRAKAAAGQSIKTGNTFLDYSLTSFAGIVENATPLTKSQYNALIGIVIERYFSFRPIYPNYTRRGILCFFHTFIIEYPLILKVEIKKEIYEFKFWPMGMEPVNPDSNFPDYKL
jgi:hypothetical protein